ncbi:MAG: SDR family NAD(P)-dependent oxidoreductase [Phycisphaerae bacterium]|nr:SDR family NAD(P)-dependent oxidoreductase [Gemmatimonadaceae bacterium]
MSQTSNAELTGGQHTQTSDKRPLAVVTGASSGIGLELAKVFLEHNYDLLIVSESEQIAAVAKALSTDDRPVMFARHDLASAKGVQAFYQRIKDTGRPVEALALNAGVGVGGQFLDNDIDAELNMIALNVISVVRLSKLVFNDMVARGHGRVLLTSSIAALVPGPYYAVYAATKAFVHSFSEAVRYELKDTGVTITALQPGATDTNFFARAKMLDTKAGVSEKDDPADVARDGFEAMMAGKDHVVAGAFRNKVMAILAEVTPESMKAAQHAKLTKPGSGETSIGGTI